MNALAPEKILAELDELWVALASQPGEPAAAGVLRACALTLIVCVEDGSAAGQASETLAELMREHPSRAIVLRVRPASEPHLDSRVFAQCWLPFGRRQQICSEQIEITASRPSLPDLPPVILALLAPDLPVVFWFRDPALFAEPLLRKLATLADKLIVDSMDARGPADLQPPAADLAWTRLTRWRAVIAQTFEQSRCRPRQVANIRVLHRGASVPVTAWYLAAWLLGAAPGASLEFTAVDAHCVAGIHGIELLAPGWTVSATMAAPAAAEVRLDSLSRRVALAERTEADLLREELSIIRPDPVFEAALAGALRRASSRP